MIKNKATILVVDDEVDICNMVGDILKDEGYDIITANGYDEALNVIKNQNVTLIITDIWMNSSGRVFFLIPIWLYSLRCLCMIR